MIKLLKEWWNGGQAKLVFQFRQKIEWQDLNKLETIYFQFFEYPNGRHFCEVTQYGNCQDHNIAKRYKPLAEYQYLEMKRKQNSG